MIRCSMCKRVPIESDLWVELETAIAERHLFDDAKPPRLSHGLCPHCFQETMDALEAEVAAENA